MQRMGRGRARLHDHNVHVRQQHVPAQLQELADDLELERADGVVVAGARLRPVHLRGRAGVRLATRRPSTRRHVNCSLARCKASARKRGGVACGARRAWMSLKYTCTPRCARWSRSAASIATTT